ncbi:putative GTPase-activating protein [Podospora australis]|uniref:GTPase-activating protein n=1 Tax=Podospora australis TaxID=1536484 RepID=A0AAN6WLV5_9PEZI|nr:putative GTPase-activating protein [Podospora australis]
MSQLDDGLADQHHHHHGRPPVASTTTYSMDSSFQDSPTIGRTQVFALAGNQGYTPNGPSTTPSSTSITTTSSRSKPKPAPSPLHSSSAVSPPTSPGPTRSDFSSSGQQTYTAAAAVPRIVTTAASEDRQAQASEKTYYNSDSSGSSSPEERSPGPGPSPRSERFSNDIRSASDPVVTANPPQEGASISQSATMAGPSSVRAEPAKGAARNSSMDSAISAISSRPTANKASQDVAGTTDIAHLIKTAGSAEAVIQYLLKEKHSQSQQNAQLWRLVDKQRAMILGLNKDLERALKDKEKYRKKLKEVLGDAEAPAVPPVPTVQVQSAAKYETGAADSLPKERVLEVPVSPGLDSDGQKHSPIDVSMAPYPITPPADQPSSSSIAAPTSTVSEILDPSHSMPKPSEHALDQYDHEAEERREREAEEASKRAAEAKELHINLELPPSRQTPREPPKMPPPRLPVGLPERSPKPEEGVSQFPLPPAPPPRRPPPAPLQLKNTQPKLAAPAEDSPDNDTDYDDILEVDEIPQFEKRGRRKTREEDEREREIIAQKEAEARSVSKKSKKSSSRKNTPKDDALPADMPASPRLVKTIKTIPQEHASLAGVLSGDSDTVVPQIALMSPGLPSSPRPMALRSPPLSPLGVSTFAGAPLSPRPPRAPIPLPPNTPLMTPSPAGEPLALTSPRPLLILKQGAQAGSESSPTKSTLDSPLERTRIFKGFVTEEYPDLLLPPNALPHINLKVASSRMKPSRASLLSLTQLEEDPVFTLAVYARSDGGELWRVEKDSASLAKLDQRLKQCPAFTARTPDRSLFSGHAPAKLDARRIALNQYLDELLNTPLDTNTAIELCKYLSTSTLPPNADETGSSTGESNPESQRTGPGGRPFRNGYLTKRGKNFGGWKARYFVLDGPLLKYYETPGGAHLGTIKLQKAQIGKQSQHPNEGSPARPGTDDADNQYRHAFLILERKKKDPNSMTRHVLCAESDRERDQWVEALLRWVDYEDPEDEDAKKEHAHDRHSSHAERAAANKKKTQGKQQQVSPLDENLIGVSYETTRQGDAPQGMPIKGSSGGQDHDSTHSQSTASSYTISAPRDPQVISNSDSWGKLSMAPPPPISQEEKKARKRSFFGFGPKARNSGDGQDSIFGSDAGSIASGNTGNQYNGPVRQVFGAPLAEAVRYCAPSDIRVPLPAVVYRCIQFLDAKNAIGEEGIFRLSGSSVTIKQLKERFNTEGDINLVTDPQFYDIHAVASLLKLYLRELPSTILTNDLRMEFIAVTELTDQKQKIALLSELVERLPQANAALLKYLIAFLIKIIDHAHLNKMTVRNVGIVFSPTLNIPAPIFAAFLQNYQPIFGIDPREYELPTTEPDNLPTQRRPSLPSSFQDQPRRPSDGRPSTSHSDSPHRHRLMESLEANRNTPTPPPMSMQQMAQMNAATMHSRNTPTPPPPQRPIAYESGQQQQGSHLSMRPPYEGGFAPSPNFEAGQLQTPPQGGYKASPGYDRPHYDSGLSPAPYEHSYKSRRESSMFMGNLNQQPSKSRLRE